MSYADMQLGGDGGEYYKIPDGTSKCRVVSGAEPIWVSFNRAEKTAKKFLDANDAIDFNRTADKELQAKRKFALWIVDRTDGAIKMAEFGVSILKQLQTLALDEDYKFVDVPDFDIKIVKEGTGMETTYTVLPLSKTPLTAEEQKAVAELQPVLEYMKAQPNVIAKVLRDASGAVIPF